MTTEISSTLLADFPAVAHVIVDLPNELGDELKITGSDGHHFVRVRRLRIDEVVTAANGSGSWRPYRVVESSGRRLDLIATAEVRVESPLTPPLRVAFSLTKGAKPEVVARQLTELGVDSIIPVVADRSVARPEAQSLVTRLQRVAREASMQCRRSWLPECLAPVTFTEAIDLPGLVVASRTGTAATGKPNSQGWTLLVGPEGGFSPTEIAALKSVPILAVGDLVLRAETAAVAGAAVLATQRSRLVA